MKTLTEQENFVYFSSTGNFAKALHCYENNGTLSELNSMFMHKKSKQFYNPK